MLCHSSLFPIVSCFSPEWTASSLLFDAQKVKQLQGNPGPTSHGIPWLMIMFAIEIVKAIPARTAQGGGGSFKDSKPIGEVRGLDSKKTMSIQQ